MEAAGGEEGGTNFSQISGVFVLAMDFSAEFLQKSKLSYSCSADQILLGNIIEY